MDLSKFLPAGSVVLLENAQKKVIIMGIMPTKRLEDGRYATYDYVGVPYPEGFVGTEGALLFNHDRIAEVCFTGYSSEERELFIHTLQTITDTADKVVRGEA